MLFCRSFGAKEGQVAGTWRLEYSTIVSGGVEMWWGNFNFSFKFFFSYLGKTGYHFLLFLAEVRVILGS